MRAFPLAILTLLLSSLLASPAGAAWPNSPYTNLPITTAPYDQSGLAIVSDGGSSAGGPSGAIILWHDMNGGVTGYDIIARHVLATGALDPAWPAAGRAVCNASGDQEAPAAVSDGAGGAIVAWIDDRGGIWDIYAQHLLASGAVDPAWPANGRALCTATGNQYQPMMVSDGAGGAIVVWWDYRAGATSDVYAQRVLASGAVDPAWPANGRAICTATGDQNYPVLAPDGSGGAIVAWQDRRSGAWDIYAQHVLASGAVDPAYPADGQYLCTATNNQQYPDIVSDGAGGAFITWADYRGGTNSDIYATHVLAAGEPDNQWPINGLAVCAATNSQYSPVLATDGAGGCIVAWYDYRNGGHHDVYAQHVLPAAVVDPAWPADGRALTTAALNQWGHRIVPDGAGGAFVAWYDYDIGAQHVLASGALDPAWPATGRVVCAASMPQEDPVLVADGSGGIIVAWTDLRNDTGMDFSDVYAQRVGRHGYLGSPEPELVAVEDVPNDQGGMVKVSWNASWLDLASDPELDYYDVLRSVPPAFAAQAAARGARVRTLAAEAAPLEPGDLVAIPMNATIYYWEFLVAIASKHYLSGYSYIAATLCDSVAGSNPETAFMVVGRNSTTTMWWPSSPMSGYSVDDLAPAAPAPFTGEYVAGATRLHWQPNAEADLAGYRLYRGTSAGFLPDETSLVAALADTGYADAGAAGHWYKLTAVDVHGNESPVATLTPGGTTAVEGGAPAALSFASPSPNPASARALLRYALPRAGAVKLAIYDAAGRQVRVLASGSREAGEQADAWDLRDDGGAPVSAGLYFARLEFAGRALVRRVAVTR